MRLARLVSLSILAIVTLGAGCKQSPPRPVAQAQTVEPALAASQAPALAPAAVRATAPVSTQPAAATQAPSAPQNPPANPAVTATPGSPKLEDVEERRGPFTLGGQAFTAALHYKRLPGKAGPDGQALESLDILNAAGAVQHHATFSFSVEKGEFSEDCSVDIQYLHGSNGEGLLLETGCLPSAPMSGGPWQILGMVNGKLAPIGKPLYAEGEMGDFVPGKVSHMGNLTQILPDELRIRLFTGYFFVSVPVRVNWMQGKLALAQHCFYQTGRGMAEGGCEMPIEGVERHPGEQELTFVRMFPESNE